VQEKIMHQRVGTYDVARKMLKMYLEKEPPLKLPYEILLYDGKKMSSPKGLGLTGGCAFGSNAAEIVRFYMIKNSAPNQACRV